MEVAATVVAHLQHLDPGRKEPLEKTGLRSGRGVSGEEGGEGPRIGPPGPGKPRCLLLFGGGLLTGPPGPGP